MKKYITSIVILLLVISVNSFAQGYLRHVVQWNETVYSIPVHYDITTNDFLALNHMDVHVDLQPGTVVLVRKLKRGEQQEGENNRVTDVKLEKLNRLNHAIAEERDRAEVPMRIQNEPMHITEPKLNVAERAEERVSFSVDPTEDIGPNGIHYKISKNGFHLVERKQTLFHLAIIYKQSVEHLKQINNLSTTDISIGQTLRVSN